MLFLDCKQIHTWKNYEFFISPVVMVNEKIDLQASFGENSQVLINTKNKGTVE